MALTTPTTKEISDTIVSQVSASISQTIPLLPLAFTRFFAKVFAGVFILLYKYSGFIFLQVFVRTASFAETTIFGKVVRPLIEWGRLIGIGDPTPATQAELTVDIVVETQTGSLPTGTQLFSAVNGITYLLTVEVVLDAATKTGSIKAQSDVDGNSGAGAIGNLQVSDVVSFVNPQSNVARDTTVASIVTTGVDGETEEAYRQRVIDRFQKQPQGGAGVDYEIWGEETPGIVNIYPYTGDQPGFVDVYVEATDTVSTPDGIPTADQLEDVKNAITFDSEGRQTRKPINAFLNVFPIDRISFDVQVVGLSVDNQSTVETSITDALTTYFLDRGPFIDGVTPLPRRDRVTVNNVTSIVDDFVSAAGGSFSNVMMNITGSISIELYSLGIGEKSKLGTVSF